MRSQETKATANYCFEKHKDENDIKPASDTQKAEH